MIGAEQSVTRDVAQTEKAIVPGSVDDYTATLRQTIMKTREIAKHFEDRLRPVISPRPVGDAKNPEPISGRSPLAEALREMRSDLESANSVFGELLASLDLP